MIQPLLMRYRLGLARYCIRDSMWLASIGKRLYGL
jgi:hypothetical protein